MNFLIVTHVLHTKKDNKFYGYAPYINEMNSWIKNVDKVTIIAPKKDYMISAIHQNYNHQNIDFIAVPAFSFTNLNNSIQSLFIIPYIILKLFFAFAKSNHIHLRCPGNMGLLGCLVQIFFPFKNKTVKYAGNWDSNSKQPISYNLQKKIVSNTFLSKKIKVLVYGNWENQSKNILPFYTATYRNSEIEKIHFKELNNVIKFIFVGTLTKGKQPQYAIELIESLKKTHINCKLEIYGSGFEKKNLEDIILDKKLNEVVTLKGIANREEMKAIYLQSHFLILPSKSEGWPKVVAEAMFHSCLPIATKVSCIPNMLDDENRGVLLTSNLNDDINKIISLIENQELYNGKVINAYNWSTKYTLDKFENDIKKLLAKND